MPRPLIAAPMGAKRSPCVCRILDLAIVMMKTAENRSGCLKLMTFYFTSASYLQATYEIGESKWRDSIPHTFG
jgi:hypothetical protein